jgi:hypothetical protein
MSKKTMLIVAAFAVAGVMVPFLADAGAAGATKAGLVGIQYGSEDFTDPENLVILTSLGQNWTQDDGNGKQWSGKWQGFLVGPVTGVVKLTVETDQKAEVEIDGNVVTSAGVKTVEGQKHPVTVSYVKTGDEYDCYLHVKWSWDGHEPSVIGGSSLVYAADVEAKLDAIVAASDDDDGDDDDDGPAVAFKYVPTGLEITIDGKPFASYYTGSSKIPRPYFAHVKSPSGIQVSRNHPPIEGKDSTDHDTFHPGIWLTFAGINKNDYWRLKKKTEHEMFVGKPEGGAGKGTFTVSNFYLDSKDSSGNRIAHEVCKYTILARPGYYLLIYDSTISSDAHDLVFGDDQEYGLGIRVQTPIEERYGGQILNADSIKGAKDAYGKASTWCDYSGVMDDTLIGMTVMPDPENFRSSWYHTRDYGLIAANPFGREKVAGGEPSEVHVKKGEKFHLGFGIAIYSAPKGTKIDRDAMYKDYLKTAISAK